MRTTLMTRRRATAGLVSATLLLAACGSSDEGTDPGPSEPLPQLDASGAEAAASSTDGEARPAPAGSVMVDLGGEDVLPESEFDTNLLPSVVVDDLNTGRKVNFRNLVPQEKPILLWMWAPH